MNELETLRAENARLREALTDVLARESRRAPSGVANDCACATLSRQTEQEYEIGRCPHQRARKVLACTPSTAEWLRNRLREERYRERMRCAETAILDLLEQPGVIVAAEKRFDSGASEKTARRIAHAIRALGDE